MPPNDTYYGVTFSSVMGAMDGVTEIDVGKTIKVDLGCVKRNFEDVRVNIPDTSHDGIVHILSTHWS